MLYFKFGGCKAFFKATGKASVVSFPKRGVIWTIIVLLASLANFDLLCFELEYERIHFELLLSSILPLQMDDACGVVRRARIDERKVLKCTNQQEEYPGS